MLSEIRARHARKALHLYFDESAHVPKADFIQLTALQPYLAGDSETFDLQQLAAEVAAYLESKK